MRCPASTPPSCTRRRRSSARSSRPRRSTTSCCAPSRTPASARRRSPPRRAVARALPAAARRGAAVSASDIETYRACPLKYKFARVFRIPQEPTLNQRFGILVHQVLERYHPSGGRTLDELLGLLEAGWRRGGFGDRGGAPAPRQGRRLPEALPRALPRRRRRAALVRARLPVPARGPHAARPRRPGRPPARRRLRAHRLQDGPPEERGAAARGRPALALRGRRPRGVAARRVAAVLPLRARRREGARADRGHRPRWIAETVAEVADGILGQGFEPTPSYSACSLCDFRIACPAAER